MKRQKSTPRILPRGQLDQSHLLGVPLCMGGGGGGYLRGGASVSEGEREEMEGGRAYFKFFHQRVVVMAGILTSADRTNSTNRPT